jgi:adenylate cyclase
MRVVIGEDAAMDWASSGLLDGLEGEKREARQNLLALLAADGYTLAELTKAVEENRLALLGVDRVLGGIHTAREIEQQTGLPAQMVIEFRRQHGLPVADAEARLFSDNDIEAARAAMLLLDAGFDRPQIIEITRVLGEGMARLSATVTAAFAEAFLQAGDSEEEVATRFADLAQRLLPATASIVVAGYEAYLRDSVQLGMLGPAELESGDAAGDRHLTICFADLVGFTRLGNRLEVHELGAVARRLADLAASLAEPPVRLVKTIGDAAMFVSSEPAALVRVALALVGAFDREELPRLRAGIASGPASVRAGDFYGRSVNLASRVTGVARPGSVLCSRDVRDAAADDFQWSSAGRHKLRGVSGQTTLYRARRAASEDTTQ